MEDQITIRSSIKGAFKRRVLLRGTLLAAIGLAPLIYAGIYIPAQALKYWGLPIFLFAIFCVTLGLLPYRLLTKTEKKPNEIIASSDETLTFKTKDKKLISIPFNAIESIDYREKELYGVAINLKNTPSDKITVYDTNFNMSQFIQNSKKRFQCDLFLPYFTERSVQRLKSLTEQYHAS